MSMLAEESIATCPPHYWLHQDGAWACKRCGDPMPPEKASGRLKGENKTKPLAKLGTQVHDGQLKRGSRRDGSVARAFTKRALATFGEAVSRGCEE